MSPAAAEFLGTFVLIVIGVGVVAQTVLSKGASGSYLAINLGWGLAVMLGVYVAGGVSGAHLNPAVSLVAALRRELRWHEAVAYALAQLLFGILGAWAAHLMFDLPTLQLSIKARTGLGQWSGEFIATFGLLLTILGTVRHRPAWIAPSVALYIAAAYWFTSSTSFANPAITVARSLTNSFAGIAPHDASLFVVAQLAGAIVAVLVASLLFDPPETAVAGTP